MAVLNPPVWLEAGTYTANHDRLVTSLLVDRNHDVNGALQSLDGGVVGPKDQLQVTANGTMTVTVNAGIAAVPRVSLTPPGVYLCYNNGSFSMAVPTQATNQRNDILVARVNDSEEGNPGDNWELYLVPGPPGPSPIDPVVPPNYVKLARINVKSAALNGGVDKIATTQVTDIRNFVTHPGGVHVVWNGIYPSGQAGRVVYDTATPGVLKIATGTNTWQQFSTDEALATRAATYGIRSDYHDNSVQKSGNATGVWDPLPADTASGNPIPTAVNVDVANYNGSSFKITIAALSKCDDVDISGHLSCQIRSGSTEIYAPGIGKGPSFYGTFWVSSENSFVANLPSNYTRQSLNFRVMFRSNWSGFSNPGADHVEFQRIRLIVEPV
jgi:hypothetical protein